MKIFNVKDVGKYSDQNPDLTNATIAPGGYVRHKVIVNDKCAVSVACFRKGQVHHARLHCHPGAAEIYYVVEGESMCLDSEGKKRTLSPGTAVYFDAGEPHNMYSAPGSDCMYYRIQIGADRHAESVE